MLMLSLVSHWIQVRQSWFWHRGRAVSGVLDGSVQVVVFSEEGEKVVSVFDGEGDLPHLGKERDKLSNSELVKKDVSKGHILRSSSRAPSRPS